MIHNSSLSLAIYTPEAAEVGTSHGPSLGSPELVFHPQKEGAVSCHGVREGAVKGSFLTNPAGASATNLCCCCQTPLSFM